MLEITLETENNCFGKDNCNTSCPDCRERTLCHIMAKEIEISNTTA